MKLLYGNGNVTQDVLFVYMHSPKRDYSTTADQSETQQYSIGHSSFT